MRKITKLFLCLSSWMLAHSVVFEAIDVPHGNTQKQLQTASSVTLDGKKEPLYFDKLIATGDKNNNEIFGLLKDFHNQPITFDDGAPYICNGTNAGVGSGLDFSSILQKNNTLYLISQFECPIGGMYRAQLEQNQTTGQLSLKTNSLEFISQANEFGGYVHCAGMATPWNSHLGSEEYESDARLIQNNRDPKTGLTNDAYFDELAKFWGGDAKKISPYYYGWSPEVSINVHGKAEYTKHYAMGRFSHELSYVMPDNKTLYMSDDGSNVGLFMFKTHRPQDLSSGTLYAAKWHQTNGQKGGSAKLTWIKLGEASDSEIKAILNPDNNLSTNDAPTFSDIFEYVEGNASRGTCPGGFSSINTSAGFECLKLKQGMAKTAAYLETRRYAALQGATTEFRKEEGITYSAKHKRLFIAMSEIKKGMEDSSLYDVGGNNDIRLTPNTCGALYALAHDSNYTATTMQAILVGKEIAEDSEGNSCDLNGISNPDNITMIQNSDLIIIGEDSSLHTNNTVWSYNLTTKELTRIATAPLDAETTSPFWYANINGFSYMTLVTQHPMEAQEATPNQKESFLGIFRMKTIKEMK